MNLKPNPDRMAELERNCLEALALPPEQRAAYLDAACSDEAIRREVGSLLAAESDAGILFQTLAGRPRAHTPFDLEHLKQEVGIAGVYEIQEKLGEGGMGVVFRARQSAPVTRDVALKIVHPEIASRQLVSLFLAERQALAMMDHPSIARVLDAGETSVGLPYLAMELVAGRSITEFCETRQLDLRKRVELFIQVCEAIQHAHNKGIIHRDIKPSNVLVADCDGKALPKVIDFGIAKAKVRLQPGITNATHSGLMLGTFEYMSPEQTEAGAHDLDARSDVYSLGVLLYRLVCGRTPLDGLSLEHSTYDEILRRIRVEAPPPASRVTRSRAIREFDWILAKALEKDRNRRYQSADGMSQDLRRYLDGEPLEAGPPSTAYRLRKLAGKFKYWVAGAVALVVLLLAASIAMAFGLRQQSRANAQARALRDVVRRIIIERPAQLAQIANRTALRGQLMRDAEGALDALSRDSANDEALQLDLARAYLSIGLAKGPYNAVGSEGDPAGASVYVWKSLHLYSALAARQPNHPEVRRGQVEALSTWLHLQYRLMNNNEGEDAARRLEAVILGMTPELRQKIQAQWYLSMGYVEWGLILFGMQREPEALELHRKALTAFRAGVPADGPRDPDMLVHLSRLQRELAITAWMFGGYTPDVEATARMAVDAVKGCGEPDCRMRHAQSQGTLGEIEWASGKKLQGVATLRKSLAEFESLVAEDPQNAVYSNAAAQIRGYLALTLAGAPGGEAVALAEINLRLAAGADAKLHKGREREMVYAITLGATLLAAGRRQDAARQLRNTIQRNRDWNANHDLQWCTLHLLSRALEMQGKYAESVNTAREAMKLAGLPAQSFHTQVLRAIAARDYASAVARWKDADSNARAEAMQSLDACAGLDERYAVLVGALIESPPKAADVASIRRMLWEPHLRKSR